MSYLIQILQLPVVSGVLVPFISFAFGYFLFRAQRKEETKLEVFRRRLNTYEQVSIFLQEVDEFAHAPQPKLLPNPMDFKEHKTSLTKKCFRLVYSSRLYLPFELADQLENFALMIDDLPKSLADVEGAIDDMNGIIEKHIGSYMTNWRVEVDRIRQIIYAKEDQGLPDFLRKEN